MAFEVKKAKRQRRPLKINLEGVSGSGKTYTALRLAFAMRRAGIGSKIVVADSENESAGLYEGVVADGERWEYDVCPMPPEKQNPAGYTEAYEYLVSQGFDIIIGDSLTHAWYGAQEIVDKIAAANRNDKFGGWAKVTPMQRKMLATLTDNRAHFIGTMRVKSEYERQERGEGKAATIKKVGTKTDQREGAEYEFDCVARLDKGDVPTDHVILVDKVRGCTAMDGKQGVNPGPDFWKPLFDWWLSAETPLDQVHAAAIRGAKTLDALKAAFAAVNADATGFRLSDAQIVMLTRLKDERKAQLAEREPAADPKPMPAAEHRTAEPVGAQWAVDMVGLFAAVGVTWDAVRDQTTPAGRALAVAAGLAPGEPHRLTDLTMPERNRLHTAVCELRDKQKALRT